MMLWRTWSRDITNSYLRITQKYDHPSISLSPSPSLLSPCVQMDQALKWVRDSFQLLAMPLQALVDEERLVAVTRLWQDLQNLLLGDDQLREKYIHRNEEEKEDEERRKNRMVYE